MTLEYCDNIWLNLSKDGNLSLLEFMLAFHLIVARKNKFQIPELLPKRLLSSGNALLL